MFHKLRIKKTLREARDKRRNIKHRSRKDQHKTGRPAQKGRKINTTDKTKTTRNYIYKIPTKKKKKKARPENESQKQDYQYSKKVSMGASWSDQQNRGKEINTEIRSGQKELTRLTVYK